MASALRIQAPYPNRRALLSSARPEGSVLRLFVPGSEHVPVGTEVVVGITIDGTALRFQLEGRVRAQFLAEAPRAGLGVVFAGDQKRAAAEMLAMLAGRSLDSGSALDSRHEVDVKCVVKLPGTKLEGALKDVSSTGAFIGAAPAAAVTSETELTIQLEPAFGRWGGRLLRARVVWVGEKRGVAGFGVRFLDAAAHVRESLKRHFPSPVPRSP